jgi:hypothetical protein
MSPPRPANGIAAAPVAALISNPPAVCSTGTLMPSTGVALQMFFVGVMRCRLNISSCRFGESLGLHFPEHSTEARHVPIATYVGNRLPRQVTDLGKDNGDGVTA